MKIRLLLLLFVTTLSHAAYVTFSPLTQSVTATSGQTKTVTVTANCIGASTEQVFLEIGLCDADGGFVSGIQSHYIYGGSSVTLTFKFNKTVSSTSSYTYKFSTVSGMTMCDNPSNQIQITVTYVPQVCNLPAPTGLSSVAGLNSISVSWNKNPNAAYYRLYYKKQGTVTYTSLPDIPVGSCGATSCPYTITGLKSGTTYDWSVEARCANNLTSDMSFATSTTLCPAAPTDINATPYSYGYTISWNPISWGGSCFLEYVDLVDNSSGTTQVTYSPTPNSGNFFYYIAAGHSFKFRLLPNFECPSSASDWKTINVTPLTCSLLPPSPSSFTLTSPCGYTGSQCGYGLFGWSPVTGANRYEVQYTIFNLSGQTITGSFQTSSISQTQSNMYASGSLGPWYVTFKVRARCSNNIWGEYSALSNTFAW